MKKVTFAIIFIFLVLVLFPHVPAGAGNHLNTLNASPVGSNVPKSDCVYKRYLNARFKFAISYPEILVPQGESDNGDGQRFVSKDGSVTLIAYGSNNALNETVSAAFKSAQGDLNPVTYKVFHNDWFVVSGLKEGKIFYRKTLVKDNIYKTFEIEYEPSQKAIYNPIVTRISQSFTHTN